MNVEKNYCKYTTNFNEHENDNETQNVTSEMYSGGHKISPSFLKGR